MSAVQAEAQFFSPAKIVFAGKTGKLTGSETAPEPEPQRELVSEPVPAQKQASRRLADPSQIYE